MSMFRKNLSASVSAEVGTPMTSGATPGLTSSVMASTPMTPSMSSSSMTPSVMTPNPMTPAFSEAMLGGGVLSREQSSMFQVPTTAVQGVHQEEEEMDDGDASADVEAEGESEKDLIAHYTSKNMFTPANAAATVGAKYINWAQSSTLAPASPTAAGSAQGTVPKPSDPVSEMAMLQHKYDATSPVIHNVVATANLGCVLDLKEIAMTARNAEYNPRRFSAVIMRIREPKSTALVFKSGKLVVTGTKSQEEARHAARKFGRVIIKVGYTQARFKDFRIENLVSTFSVNYPIHLERLYKSLPSNMHSQYEPEVFPGLICRAPGGTLLIFVSGKCVMIGMKSKEDIEKAYKYILPKLEEHRKK